jgi:hypothetical protein
MKKMIVATILLSLTVLSQSIYAQDYMTAESVESVKSKLKDNNRTLRHMKGTVIEEKKEALDTYYNHELERIHGSERNLEKLCASLVHELDDLKIKKIMKGKHKQPFFDKKIRRFTNIKHEMQTELHAITRYEGASDNLSSEMKKYKATLQSSLSYVNTIINFLEQKRREKKLRK